VQFIAEATQTIELEWCQYARECSLATLGPARFGFFKLSAEHRIGFARRGDTGPREEPRIRCFIENLAENFQ
jgi:hypothetical protein